MTGGDAASPGVTSRWDGEDVAAYYGAATHWLARHAARVDALNVFPVPDGDTGTNMRLTMEAATRALRSQPNGGAGGAAAAAAQAALLGARGNSGVILSQVLGGVASGLRDKAVVEMADLVVAADEAVRFAYRAVTRPVEGTLLTAVKDVAAAVRAAVQRGDPAQRVLEVAVLEAHASVARSPALLPALREAGVVDAGGEGLAVLLDGLLRYARGESLDGGEAPEIVRPRAEAVAEGAHVLDENGYCTNFVVRAAGADVDRLRSAIVALGTSAVVAGAGNLMKVHVHTEHPGLALEEGARLGDLAAIEITNMRDQVEALQAGGDETESASGRGPVAGAATPAAPVVAVVPSAQLQEVFAGLGTRALLGGPTMNPSVGEILAAADATGGEPVFVLPNNSNVVLTAQEAARLSPHRRLVVIPTTTVPQGVAAAVAHLAERTAVENAATMAEAAGTVTTIEVTTASRAATLLGTPVQQGQAIALVDGTLVVAADDARAAALDATVRAYQPGHTLLTLYWGQGVTDDEVDLLRRQLLEHLPEIQFELVAGGQPHYPFIIALE